MTELFAEVVVKCELKPDEDVKAFTSVTIAKMATTIMIIFQGQRYCSEVMCAWNYSEEEIITKISEEWNLLKS